MAAGKGYPYPIWMQQMAKDVIARMDIGARFVIGLHQQGFEIVPQGKVILRSTVQEGIDGLLQGCHEGKGWAIARDHQIDFTCHEGELCRKCTAQVEILRLLLEAKE